MNATIRTFHAMYPNIFARTSDSKECNTAKETASFLQIALSMSRAAHTSAYPRATRTTTNAAQIGRENGFSVDSKQHSSGWKTGIPTSPKAVELQSCCSVHSTKVGGSAIATRKAVMYGVKNAIATHHVVHLHHRLHYLLPLTQDPFPT